MTSFSASIDVASPRSACCSVRPPLITCRCESLKPAITAPPWASTTLVALPTSALTCWFVPTSATWLPRTATASANAAPPPGYTLPFRTTRSAGAGGSAGVPLPEQAAVQARRMTASEQRTARRITIIREFYSRRAPRTTSGDRRRGARSRGRPGGGVRRCALGARENHRSGGVSAECLGPQLRGWHSPLRHPRRTPAPARRFSAVVRRDASNARVARRRPAVRACTDAAVRRRALGVPAGRDRLRRGASAVRRSLGAGGTCEQCRRSNAQPRAAGADLA